MSLLSTLRGDNDREGGEYIRREVGWNAGRVILECEKGCRVN